MTYISGMVAPVPNANREAFLAHAREAAEHFKKHGALSIVECWGDDVPDGEVTSFPLAVKLKEDETVVFSWIVWPSKEAADTAFQAMMEDPAFSQENNPMPFDGQRMIFGGFVPVFEA